MKIFMEYYPKMKKNSNILIHSAGTLLFFVITVLHDWVYKMHTKWFKLSIEKFDEIHYTGIAFFKIAILFFNIVPYFALRIIS